MYRRYRHAVYEQVDRRLIIQADFVRDELDELAGLGVGRGALARRPQRRVPGQGAHQYITDVQVEDVRADLLDFGHRFAAGWLGEPGELSRIWSAAPLA